MKKLQRWELWYSIILTMVIACCLLGCPTKYSKAGNAKILHRFPSNRTEQWLEIVRAVNGANWKPPQSPFLCSDHFSHSSHENAREDGKKRLISNAVPSLRDEDFQRAALASTLRESRNTCIPHADHNGYIQKFDGTSSNQQNEGKENYAVSSERIPVLQYQRSPLKSLQPTGARIMHSGGLLISDHTGYSKKPGGKENRAVKTRPTKDCRLLQASDHSGYCSKVSPAVQEIDIPRSISDRSCDYDKQQNPSTSASACDSVPIGDNLAETGAIPESCDHIQRSVPSVRSEPNLSVQQNPDSPAVSKAILQSDSHGEISAPAERVDRDQPSPETSGIQVQPTLDDLVAAVVEVNCEISARTSEESAVDAAIARCKKENEILQDKLARLEKVAQRICKENSTLRNSYRKLSKKYNTLQEIHKRSTENLKKMLNADQIAALGRRSTQGLKWNHKTVQDALVLKMKCGSTGYNEIRKRFPYSHIRSLQKEVQHLTFASGELEEVFDMLEVVASSWIERKEDDFMISIDEMAIEPGEMMDPNTKKMIGKVTLRSHEGVANKALVVLLGGITTRRKITVAYYLTGKKKKNVPPEEADTGKELGDILIRIIVRVEKIGLKIHCVTSDMGPTNQALWRYLGVFADKTGVRFAIPHPVRAGALLCFMADVPHVIKSAKRMFMSHRYIRLPQNIVCMEKLPTDLVDFKHVKNLCDFEGKFELRVAPKLTEEALEGSGHFSKMKVSNTTSVLNNRTVSGLNLLAVKEQDPVYLTTAWFIKLFNQWFALMTNRSRKLALSKQKKGPYKDALFVIAKTAFVFQHLQFEDASNDVEQQTASTPSCSGQQGASSEARSKKKTQRRHCGWKPVQTGVLLSSIVILYLQDVFLNRMAYVFFLTGPFTQDFLENLFSCIRFRQSLPHALAFKDNLKVITLSQYCEASASSSYDQDDGELLDFLTFTKQKAQLRKNEESASQIDLIEVPRFTDDFVRRVFVDWERLVLYDMAGAVLHSLKEVFSTCDNCFRALLWQGAEPHPYASLTLLNQFSPGATLQVSNECFLILCKAELTFRYMRDILRDAGVTNTYEFRIGKLANLWKASSVPACHTIWKNYLKRFFCMRYRIYGQKRRAQLNKQKTCNKSSKSMAMHKGVK